MDTYKFSTLVFGKKRADWTCSELTLRLCEHGCSAPD